MEVRWLIVWRILEWTLG